MSQQQIHRALQSCLLGMTIVITVFVSFITTSLPTQANISDQPADQPADQSVSLSSRHPDAGIWVVYRGSNTVDDLQKPYIKGAMAYAAWKNLYTGPNEFKWSTLDAELDFIINKAGKKAMVVVTAGYCPSLEWPEWIGERVAVKKAKHSMGCHPFQYWDPVYVDLYKDYISAFASHLAEFDANDARPN